MALEELNSEYIALKRGQSSRDDLSAVLVSLRTRYSDIRDKVGNQSAVILQFILYYELFCFYLYLMLLSYVEFFVV